MALSLPAGTNWRVHSWLGKEETRELSGSFSWQAGTAGVHGVFRVLSWACVCFRAASGSNWVSVSSVVELWHTSVYVFS